MISAVTASAITTAAAIAKGKAVRLGSSGTAEREKLSGTSEAKSCSGSARAALLRKDPAGSGANKLIASLSVQSSGSNFFVSI
jgi:hypothetical protein